MINDRDSGWIVTYTGKRFWPLDPRPQDIDIVDIAHALSNIVRFTGHVSSFYSVAQHSYLVSKMCRDHALYGLLHDASEAYLCDISTPVKHSDVFAPYREAEQWLQTMILHRFGIDAERGMPDEVRLVDEAMRVFEGVGLMPHHPGSFWTDKAKLLSENPDIIPWPPRVAEERFLFRFHYLEKQKVFVA